MNEENALMEKAFEALRAEYHAKIESAAALSKVSPVEAARLRESFAALIVGRGGFPYHAAEAAKPPADRLYTLQTDGGKSPVFSDRDAQINRHGFDCGYRIGRERGAKDEREACAAICAGESLAMRTMSEWEMLSEKDRAVISRHNEVCNRIGDKILARAMQHESPEAAELRMTAKGA